MPFDWRARRSSTLGTATCILNSYISGLTSNISASGASAVGTPSPKYCTLFVNDLLVEAGSNDVVHVHT